MTDQRKDQQVEDPDKKDLGEEKIEQGGVEPDENSGRPAPVPPRGPRSALRRAGAATRLR